MKKRIFISMHYMELGGAEMALIGMLQAMDYSRYNVDLFLHAHRGELMKLIPKECNVLPEIKEYAHIESSIKKTLLNRCWGILYGRVKAKLQKRYYMRRKGITEFDGNCYTANCVSPFLPHLRSLGEYDLAISFLRPHKYVIEKVMAKKKICWIHTDYTRVNIDVEQELPSWSEYDHVMSISPDVTKSFIKIFPSLKDKIVEMENILSSDFVRTRATEFDATAELGAQECGGPVILLSIGRYTYQKNFDNVPDICRRLIDDNVNVRWFLIGYGTEEAVIREKIEETGMQEHVIILGKRSNPYPYIKACDIYVQPSRYEGKSITVREAQMLCKPVAVTDYPTASSQIKQGLDGVIIPMDNVGCARGLVEFVLDKLKQKQIAEYLSAHDYGNLSEIEKLYGIIDS